MRVVPVVDVRGGIAVHARGGERAHYAPLASVLHPGSDPVAIARAAARFVGHDVIYLAHLDAIERETPGLALELTGHLAAAGLSAWVDAGARTAIEGAAVAQAGAGRVVVGLETWSGPAALVDLVERLGPGRVMLGLDLRDGVPILPPAHQWRGSTPLELVAEAAAAGVNRVLVLDLARVGRGSGTGTIGLLEAIRSRHPGVELAAGGGIRGPADLPALERIGVSAVLVGSALHEGRWPVAEGF